MIGWNILWWPIIAGIGALAVIIAILVFIFWVWMIIDSVKRDFKNSTEKIIWVIVIVLAGWIGALIYFIIIKSMNPKGISKKQN